MKIYILTMSLFLSLQAYGARYEIQWDCGTTDDSWIIQQTSTWSSQDVNLQSYLFKGQLTTYKELRNLISDAKKSWEKESFDVTFLVQDIAQFDVQIKKCENQLAMLERIIKKKMTNCPADNSLKLENSKVLSWQCYGSSQDQVDNLLKTLSPMEVWQLSAHDYGKFSGFALYESEFKTARYFASVYFKPAMACMDSSGNAWSDALDNRPADQQCQSARSGK